MDYWTQYKPGLYKHVVMAPPHPPGPPNPDAEHTEEGRYRQSLNRSRLTVEGLALCNPWEWWGTITLSPENGNRQDLEGFRRRFVRYVRNVRRCAGPIAYMLVPELHADGCSWHLHGLFMGLGPLLEPYQWDVHLPRYIRDRVPDTLGEIGGPRAAGTMYRWPGAEQRFGWTVFERVKDQERAARYITKYIGKGRRETADRVGPNKSLYYASQGLERPKKCPPPPEVTEGGKHLQVVFAKEYEHCLIEWLRVEG